MKYCSRLGAILPLLLSISLLTACGFHLRGTMNINSNMDILAVSGNDITYVRALTRTFTNSGIKVTESAPYRLKVLQIEKQPILATHASAENYEKCLTLKVLYQLETYDNLALFDPIELTAERHVTENKNFANVAQSEERQTYNEMKEDLIFRTINRLKTISKEKLKQEEDQARKADTLKKEKNNQKNG